MQGFVDVGELSRDGDGELSDCVRILDSQLPCGACRDCVEVWFRVESGWGVSMRDRVEEFRARRACDCGRNSTDSTQQSLFEAV